MKIEDPSSLALRNKVSKDGMTSVVNMSLPTERQLNRTIQEDSLQKIVQDKQL